MFFGIKPFLKTLWQKEKMPVSSIFFSSFNVFLPFYKIIECFESYLWSTAANFDRCKILSFCKDLTFSQATNFRLFKIERVFRQHISKLMKSAESFSNG